MTVAIFVLAPSILGLTGFAAFVSYALAAIHLAMTLLTDMPLGAIKIIPMRLHALVEMLVGPVLFVAALVLPTIFGDKREFFLVILFSYGTCDLGGVVAVKLRSYSRRSVDLICGYRSFNRIRSSLIKFGPI